jgi:hypothetical protein
MRFLWFFILAVTLTLSVFYNNAILWIMAAVLVLLPLTSFFLRLHASKKISASIFSENDYAFQNSEFDVTIHFENKSVVPLPELTAEVEILSAYSVESRSASVTLSGKGEAELIFRLSPPHCAVILVKTFDVYSTAFTRSLPFTVKNTDLSVYIPVIPVFDENAELNLSAERGISPAETRINEIIAAGRARGGEFSDIRLFSEGDRESRIHWKLSAKSEDLLVRDFNEKGLPRVLLLILPGEVCDTPPDVTDRLFYDTKRFAKRLSAEKIPCAFFLSGYDIIPRNIGNDTEIDRFIAEMISLLFTKEKGDTLTHGEIFPLFDIIVPIGCEYYAESEND